MPTTTKIKKETVISHWYTLVPNFKTSIKDFYDMIEAELKARQVPELKINRIDLAEGGMMSAQRQYLRMSRERWTFDICAAPFGTSFFFSCRLVEKRFSLIKLIVAAIVLLGISSFLSATIGRSLPHMGNIVGIILLLVSALILYAMATNYKDTYYRQDTRLMYLETIPAIVKFLTEKVTAAEGIKLIKSYEFSSLDEYKSEAKPAEST